MTVSLIGVAHITPPYIRPFFYQNGIEHYSKGVLIDLVIKVRFCEKVSICAQKKDANHELNRSKNPIALKLFVGFKDSTNGFLLVDLSMIDMIGLDSSFSIS